MLALGIDIIVLFVISLFFYKGPARTAFASSIEKRGFRAHNARVTRSIIAKAGCIAHQKTLRICEQRLEGIGIFSAVMPRKDTAMRNGRGWMFFFQEEMAEVNAVAHPLIRNSTGKILVEAVLEIELRIERPVLTPGEEALDARTAALRFDIELLARRLVEATRWLLHQTQTAQLRIGYFGASTGAAAALVAAAELPEVVAAVVSRGGRPDLAREALRQVIAPTLLIVGSRDPVVLELNRQAFAQLPGKKKLEIVPGATHLFEEPGALESVAQLAKNWFALYLGGMRNKPQAA